MLFEVRFVQNITYILIQKPFWVCFCIIYPIEFIKHLFHICWLHCCYIYKQIKMPVINYSKHAQSFGFYYCSFVFLSVLSLYPFYLSFPFYTRRLQILFAVNNFRHNHKYCPNFNRTFFSVDIKLRNVSEKKSFKKFL